MGSPSCQSRRQTGVSGWTGGVGGEQPACPSAGAGVLGGPSKVPQRQEVLPTRTCNTAKPEARNILVSPVASGQQGSAYLWLPQPQGGSLFIQVPLVSCSGADFFAGPMSDRPTQPDTSCPTCEQGHGNHVPRPRTADSRLHEGAQLQNARLGIAAVSIY